jgi:hypothetical protein
MASSTTYLFNFKKNIAMKNYIIIYTDSFHGENKPTECKVFNSKLTAEEEVYRFLNSSINGHRNATVISITELNEG